MAVQQRRLWLVVTMLMVLTITIINGVNGRGIESEPHAAAPEHFSQLGRYELLDYNPVANPKAIVVSGNARFTVLTSRLIRMEYSNRAVFEVCYSLFVL
jgi:hypothetical protein